MLRSHTAERGEFLARQHAQSALANSELCFGGKLGTRTARPGDVFQDRNGICRNNCQWDRAFRCAGERRPDLVAAHRGRTSRDGRRWNTQAALPPHMLPPGIVS